MLIIKVVTYSTKRSFIFNKSFQALIKVNRLKLMRLGLELILNDFRYIILYKMVWLK